MSRRRSAIIALVVAANSAACTRPNPAFCCLTLEDCARFDTEEVRECEGEQVCVANQCVPTPDAAGVDGDAEPDASTADPIVTTYQPADLVLGQPDLVTEGIQTCTQPGIRPASVAVANGVLYAGGFSQSRALVWNPRPVVNNANATRVLGQTTFTNCSRPATVGANNFWDHAYVAAGGAVLVAGDFFRNRVLIWSPAPAANNQNATLVLGQPDFTSSDAGSAANQLSNPSTPAWTDGTRLVVPDRGNHRVLVWNNFPTTNGEAADLVLGQPGFGQSSPPTSPDDSNLDNPSGVWLDGTRLVIADADMNRVLIWSTFPGANGEAADIVLGQSSFDTSSSALSATGMSSPNGIAVIDDWLFVADSGNDRILVFHPFPNTSGEPAKYVLGQPDLVTGANNPGPTPQSLDIPSSIAIDGSHLWVVDYGHERIIRFALAAP